MTTSIGFSETPSNELQHGECWPLITSKQALGQPHYISGLSLIFHLLMTYCLESYTSLSLRSMRTRAWGSCESLQPGVRQPECSSIIAWIIASSSNPHRTDNLAMSKLQRVQRSMYFTSKSNILASNYSQSATAKATTAVW